MHMHAAHRPGGHRRSASAVRLAAALVTAGCAVALSARGSSGGLAFNHAVRVCEGPPR